VLYDDLHLEKFNLRHVPHSLRADQKRSWVELSREFLQILKQGQQYEFEHILTAHESWFSFEYFHYSCWAANPDDVSEIPKQKIQSDKSLISIMGQHNDQKSVVCFERHEI
jgi:hypothetical protein